MFSWGGEGLGGSENPRASEKIEMHIFGESWKLLPPKSFNGFKRLVISRWDQRIWFTASGIAILQNKKSFKISWKLADDENRGWWEGDVMHNFAWSRRKGLPFNSYSKYFGGKTFQLSQKMCILVFSKIAQIFSWGGAKKKEQSGCQIFSLHSFRFFERPKCKTNSRGHPKLLKLI